MSKYTFLLLLLNLVYLRAFSLSRFNRFLASFHLVCNVMQHSLQWNLLPNISKGYREEIWESLYQDDTHTVQCNTCILHRGRAKSHYRSSSHETMHMIAAPGYIKNAAENSSCFNQNYNTNHLARMLICITNKQDLSDTLKNVTFLISALASCKSVSPYHH